MTLEQLKLLLQKDECEHLDFKATFYRKENYKALLLDVMSMANANYCGSRYIIMGVKQDIQGTCTIIGIDENHKVDQSTIQQLLFQNIEPMISTSLHYISVEEKTIAILEIKNTTEQPYLLKKKFGNLHEGTCYVRREAGNGYALRHDYIRFLKQHQQFEVKMLDSFLRALDVKNGCAALYCSLRNITNYPVTILYGILEVSYDGQVLSKHRLYGYEKRMVGADFKITLPPMSEEIGDFMFGFTSTDSLRLQLDKYGHSNAPFQFSLTLIDSLDNHYATKEENCNVMARGDFLWKVLLAEKKR